MSAGSMSSDEIETLMLVHNVDSLAERLRAASIGRPSNRCPAVDCEWPSDADARASLERYSALRKLGKRYGTDKVHHGFLPIYADLLGAPEAVSRVLEIGVFHGASIQMWRDYFPKATVYGVDAFTGVMGNGEVACAGSCVGDLTASPFGPRVKLLKADQANATAMAGMVASLSRAGVQLDVVIDDGSHKYRDQQQSLAQLLPLVRPGGYYIIEDVHTSLQQGYDAPPHSAGTTLNVIRRFMQTRRIDASPHMLPAQRRYLEAWIEYARPMSGVLGGTLKPRYHAMEHSAVCIVKKAATPRSRAADEVR